MIETLEGDLSVYESARSKTSEDPSSPASGFLGVHSCCASTLRQIYFVWARLYQAQDDWSAVPLLTIDTQCPHSQRILDCSPGQKESTLKASTSRVLNASRETLWHLVGIRASGQPARHILPGTLSVLDCRVFQQYMEEETSTARLLDPRTIYGAAESRILRHCDATMSGAMIEGLKRLMGPQAS